jgi:23S rRNA (cytidine1920-2'-O)/16S rRNA (cytidine1409-2'-O)-methyltransferase
VTRRRLDAELVRRGLAVSQTEAREAIRSGLVTVGGAPAAKATTMVAADVPVALSATPPRFASRGGEKLQAALDRFDLDVSGADCLDAGASTGGFTDCLLQAGAARVGAVDVGYGQLDWRLQGDARVTVMDRTNVRELHGEDLGFVPGVVVADLSFISLRTVIGALAVVAAPSATFIVLVKPQFEAGADDVGRGGVVRDPEVWRRVLDGVARAFVDAGVGPLGVMASPLVGPAGNVEFLMHAQRGSTGTALDIDGAVADGEELRRA